MRIFNCCLDDRILLDGNISITITKIKQNYVGLGVKAPKQMSIARLETMQGRQNQLDKKIKTKPAKANL